MKNLIFIKLLLFFTTMFFTSCENPVIPEEENHPPEILAVIAEKVYIYGGEQVTLHCNAVDPDGDHLIYQWNDGGIGTFHSNTVSVVVWEAPVLDHELKVSISVFVGDGEETVSGSINITIMVKEEPEPEASYYIKSACDDAYVSEEYPDENYGGEAVLETGPGSYTYLRFDIQDISDYIDIYNLASVEKVEIRLIVGYNNTLKKPVGTTEMYGMSWDDSFWVEEYITYNTKPDVQEKIAEVKDITFEITGSAVFDVKKDFLSRLYDHYSVMIHTPSPTINSSCYFYSKELKDYLSEYAEYDAPYLWIKYWPE